MPSGNYSVRIRDQQNCSDFGTFSVESVPPTIFPSTNPCGIEYRCKGNREFQSGSTFTRNDGERCTEDLVCAITGEVISSQQTPMVWELKDCCCAKELVCPFTGESFGWLPCGSSLVTTPGCCYIYLVCGCTGRVEARFDTDGECWDFSCDRLFGPIPPPTGSKNTDYVVLQDTKTKENIRFTFEEIANKTYKTNYPNMPNIDLNQKTTLNGKSGTIYELLKPKRFLFSVSPNPFEANPTVSLFVTSDFNADSDKATMTLSNELGQVISTEALKNLQVGENTIRPDFTNQPSGMYFIAIELKDKKEVKKAYKK